MFIYILIFIIIIQSLLVILSRNAMQSILFLISTYVLTAFCFLRLGADYLAVLLAIVYIGAISILFIFVIMMLNLRILEVYNSRVTFWPLGLFIGIFFLVIILYCGILDYGLDLPGSYNPLFEDYTNNWASFIPGNYTSMEIMAQVIFCYYPHFVVFAAFILCFAMLGSIILTVGIGEKPYTDDIFISTRRGDLRLKYWRSNNNNNNLNNN